MKPATKNMVFWISASVIIVSLVVALSTTMSIYSSRQMISKEVQSLDVFVGQANSRHLGNLALEPPYNANQKARLDAYFKEVLYDPDILEVRIWLKNGYIQRLPGSNPLFVESELSERIITAFDNKLTKPYRFFKDNSSAVSSATGGDADNAAGSEAPPVSTRRLSVLIPLKSQFSNRVNTVVEIIEDATVVVGPLRRVQTMIWLIAAFGLILYPALLIYANAMYRKRKEHEIETIKTKQLEAVNSMVVTFNHEVNQPLTGIITYAELLRKSVSDDERLLKFAERIQEQTTRLGQLVKRIGEITKVETTEYLEGTRMLDLDKSTAHEPAKAPTVPLPPE